MQTVDTVLSPYELVLREIERGALNPFDIDLEYLIEMFRKEAGSLKEWEYFEEAGRFLEASAKLLKVQIEEIFPRPKRKKVTIKEVREVLVETEDTCELEHDLSFMWDYTPKVGRPTGAKDKQERKFSWKEFWDIAQKNIKEVLHEEVDYHTLAKEVREKLLKGEPIRTLREFIA